MNAPSWRTIVSEAFEGELHVGQGKGYLPVPRDRDILIGDGMAVLPASGAYDGHGDVVFPGDVEQGVHGVPVAFFEPVYAIATAGCIF